jgi:hypothetical protein
VSKVEPLLIAEMIENKKCYMIDNIYYYKVIGMQAAYYLKVSDYNNISLKQNTYTLYEHTVQGFIEIKSYIKSMKTSDILFIATNITSQFKMYDLEKA